jgi:hypothetical protein
MVPIAVRRLHYQGVGTFRRDGIANDRQATPPNVTRKDQSLCFPAFGAVEHHRSGAEDVPGVDIGSPDTRDDVERLVVRLTDHEIHGTDRMTESIERLDEFLFSLGQEFSVPLLDVGRVCEHDRGKIPGCGCGPDRLVVPFRYQVGKPA